MSSEFTPSQAEAALTARIFEKVDTNKLGVITSDAAVNVFSGSKLSFGVLGEIWSLADKENNGFLTRKGVAIALRLMGHAQRGERVSESLLSKPGMPPTIEGYVLPILQQDTGNSPNRAKSPALSIPPPLTPQDKTKFMKIFLSCNPVNGMLSGEKASEVFVKSKLPVEKLSQIWNLADTHKRGSLDSTDFSIAMYLIQACMSGQLPFVPTSLPPGLYEQASGKSSDSVAVHSTGSSSTAGAGAGSFTSRVASSPVQPQYTGSQSLQPQTTGTSRFGAGAPILPSRPVVQSNQSNTGSLIQPQSTGLTSQWDVTPMEKANADKFFDQLDELKRGYIEGDVAVPFMLQSKLPEDVLAQIWDLADLHNDGRLTRDGFAVAMHLTQKKLTGKNIPATLPPSLVPPSLRGAHAAPPAPQLSIQESIQDLLWDDPPSSPTTSPPQPLQPQRTGPLQSPPQVLHPQRTGPLSSQTTDTQLPDPVPQFFSASNPSSFGGSQFSGTRDLLDDDDTGTPQLHDRSAEIGNARNHLNSTGRALETVKTERIDVDQKLADQAAQLSSLQTQLTSAKTSYETETRLLETLRERYATQNTEIKKLREDLITAESDVSALRAEKSEVQGNLLRDKDEVRELQKKMASAGAEIETLKVDIEKLKKDAKQQKGLLAIAKKQLATREAEKAKVESELQDAQMELKDIVKEQEETEAELAKDVPSKLTNGYDISKSSSLDNSSLIPAQPLPAAQDFAPSPPASVRSASIKSTNPFDRLAFTGTPRSESPFVAFASSPTVSTGPSLSSPMTDDPFGLPTDFAPTEEPETFSSEVVPNTTDDATTSTPKLGVLANGEDADAESRMRTGPELTPGSDSEDQFSTPLSTVTSKPHPESPTLNLSDSSVSSYLVLDAAAANFPDLSVTPPPETPIQNPETDLSSNVKELEIDDTDSSDESEEGMEKEQMSQQIPLEVAGTPQPAASTFDDMFSVSSEFTQPAATALTMDSTREQIHGTDTNPASFTSFEPSSSIDGASSSVSKPNGAAADVAGKNAFDEAMGIMPADHTTSTKDCTFDFGTAFDDNFDFAAAKAQTEKPLLSPPSPPAAKEVMAAFPAPPQNGQFDSVFGVVGNSSNVSQPPVSQPVFARNQSLSFDDAFGSESSNVQSQSPASNTQSSIGISFTPPFGEQRPSKALALDTFPPPKNPPPQPTPSVTFPPSSPDSGTYSSLGLSASNTRRTGSPSPDLSPPQLSPKLRPPTGSSDKLKDPPTRHSRLSIRLPFGRKKKSYPQPPPIPSQLSPASEELVSDDDDTVKQLTSMGFDREDAVAALERNSYDFQRALNSLLGAQ